MDKEALVKCGLKLLIHSQISTGQPCTYVHNDGLRDQSMKVGSFYGFL